MNATSQILEHSQQHYAMTRSMRDSCGLDTGLKPKPPPSLDMRDLIMGLGLDGKMRGYDRYYAVHFAKYRNSDDFSLLQLSFDWGDARNLLLLWVAYFEALSPASVGGIRVLLKPMPLSEFNVLNQDIKSKACKYDPYKCESIRVIEGDASDSLVLRQKFVDMSPSRDSAYDIIVDDWSHHPAHQILAFAWLFRLVKPGGVYVIQNLEPSYWSQPGAEVNGYSLFGSGIGKPPDRNAVEKFKQLVDVLMLRHSNVEVRAFGSSVGELDIFSVTFGEDVLLIHKKDAGSQYHQVSALASDMNQNSKLILKPDIDKWTQDAIKSSAMIFV